MEFSGLRIKDAAPPPLPPSALPGLAPSIKEGREERVGEKCQIGPHTPRCPTSFLRWQLWGGGGDLRPRKGKPSALVLATAAEVGPENRESFLFPARPCP